MRLSEVTRRNIVDYLLLRDYPFHGRLDLISFLKRTWDLSSMPSTDSRFSNAEGDIHQHMINNYDWENEYLLLTYLDLVSCNDETFITFLENCVHPLVLKEESQISETVIAFNKELQLDGLMLKAAEQISGRPIYKITETIAADEKNANEEKYEVVLSFAGEDRSYVEEVAEYLKNIGVRVFYDRYEESTLWGKDLAEHLDKVYRGAARYCVMFISKAYADKVWTNHERRSALAKAIEEKTEYILPARFDDTEIQGVRPTIGYVNLSAKTPDELAALIVRKLGRQLDVEGKLGRFGIPKLASFNEDVSALRETDVVSCVLLNLDNFELVNEQYGHTAGNKVIREAINISQLVIRGKGRIFHRFASEVLLLLPNFESQEACAVAERIRGCIEAHDFPVIGQGFVTATLGVSTCPSFCTLDELESAADTAAMGAKRTGKNQVIHSGIGKVGIKTQEDVEDLPFTSDLDENELDLLSLIATLRYEAISDLIIGRVGHLAPERVEYHLKILEDKKYLEISGVDYRKRGLIYKLTQKGRELLVKNNLI